MPTNGTVPNRRLSGVDAAFLYLERKETPLHMAAVCVFDGPLPFDEFVAAIASKMHLMPRRYRQVPVAPPFNLGYPTLEDDPRFDVRDHIFRARVDRPGRDGQLEDLAGRILTRLMDRRKPMWDLHIIEGLSGGRGGLIMRLHHSLADGISGALQLWNLVSDLTPKQMRALRRPRERTPVAAANQPSLAEAIASGLRTSLGHLVAAETGIFQFAAGLLGGLGEVAPLMPEVLGAVERLPFNKPCSGERKFCWAEVDFAEVQAIRAAAGGSVNDVVLTVVTQAISRYVRLHGQSVAGRLMRMVCPVNLRRDENDRLGNQITFLPVVLPLDIDDPLRMLGAVAIRTAAMKKARAADFITLAASCIGVTPPFVQAALWRGISNVMLPLPLFNMICTNIAGPTEPIYCLGRRMTACYPQVPTGYELGVNCAVMSYCGRLYFGLIADAAAAPDFRRLRDLLRERYEELCRAAGLRRVQRAPRKRRVTPPPRPKPASPPVPPVPEPEPEPEPEPVLVAAAAACGKE